MRRQKRNIAFLRTHLRNYTTISSNCMYMSIKGFQRLFPILLFLYGIQVLIGQEKVVINIRVLTCPGASLVVLGVKNPLANTGDAGDTDSVPGLGRCPGGSHGNPL